MFLCLNEKNSLEIFSGKTLIVPAISVGNVGQLACDLIISTLNLKKVGYFNPECFLPLIGNNPLSNSAYDKDVLSINCEVYAHSTIPLSIMQIRSPLIKSKSETFQNDLLEWMKECKFKELIILSSCHSYERIDQQLSGTPFRYLASPAAQTETTQFNLLQWVRLEERGRDGEEELFLPGAGLTKSLFLDCCSRQVPSIVLLVFCAEGDNIPEALILASHLNQWKRYLNPTDRWKSPPSWVHLFGNFPPSELF